MARLMSPVKDKIPEQTLTNDFPGRHNIVSLSKCVFCQSYLRNKVFSLQMWSVVP